MPQEPVSRDHSSQNFDLEYIGNTHTSQIYMFYKTERCVLLQHSPFHVFQEGEVTAMIARVTKSSLRLSVASGTTASSASSSSTQENREQIHSRTLISIFDLSSTLECKIPCS
ncbi:hypothetical protein BV22DRAFT_1037425 [Leucogyrophana mollusca]|uniref:Uncharacterized protein n=1 Tax=Leucogyrophana mollusca TaxID=85980 RepID=A0ACB8BAP5_9AGAM|nr:hypothetical protein BV22DRAFT_1037425 [Leucogyrophana mollusca]